MIPIKQNIIVGNPEGRKGNCMQAGIASLLELSLEEVPHFIEQENWWEFTKNWLLQKGYILRERSRKEQVIGYSLAIGLSPRNIYHCVVALDGNIVFDVHPTNAGLLDIDYYWILEKI